MYIYIYIIHSIYEFSSSFARAIFMPEDTNKVLFLQKCLKDHLIDLIGGIKERKTT